MAAITTRSTSGTGATVKNSTLTNAEVDANFINLNVDIQTRLLKTGGTNLYIGSQANSARFPNATTVFSDVDVSIQKNEPHHIGLISEKTGFNLSKNVVAGSSGGTTITLSDVTGIYIGQVVYGVGIATDAVITNINTGTNVITVSIANTGTPSGTAYIMSYGVGLYGVGYTFGITKGVGVIGEAHVDVTGSTGRAIGIQGYSNDTHAGGSNIGLYGSAENGLTNYSLYLNKGDIYSESTVNKTWYLNSNLTFSGAYSITIPTLALGTYLSVIYGGTGAADATGARSNLGVVIGSHVQAYNANLTTLGGLSYGLNNFIVGNGSTWQVASDATARTALGLGSIATQNSNAISITGGSLSGISSIGVTTLNASTLSLVNVLSIGNGGTGLTGVGASGTVLTSNGAGLAYATPSYVPSQTTFAGRYLKSDGVTASWDALDISSLDMVGTLPVVKGGTGLTSLTNNGILVGSGVNNVISIAPGAAKTVLRSDGTSWLAQPAAGMVVQTVNRKVDDKAVYTIPTAGQLGVFISVLDTQINPQYSGSQILVQYNISFETDNNTVFRLFRNVNGTGDVEIGRNSLDPNFYAGIWCTGYDGDNASTPMTNHYMYLDSPNVGAGSGVIYKLMIQSAGVGAYPFCLNRTVSSPGWNSYEVGTTTVLLQEIY
jgi:hypothetical protein